MQDHTPSVGHTAQNNVLTKDYHTRDDSIPQHRREIKLQSFGHMLAWDRLLPCGGPSRPRRHAMLLLSNRYTGSALGYCTMSGTWLG